MTPADIQARLGLSDAVIARVEIHRALLAEWSGRMNLVGPKELERYWPRHALDSLQLVRLAPEARRWVDLGAGAGFPGLLIAAALADEPGAEIVLIESIGKKAAFLRAAAEAMAVPATVRQERVETSPVRRQRFDVVTARAFAPLPRIIECAMPFFEGGALGLFPKGADARQELADAAAAGWSVRAAELESLSDPAARILRIEGASRDGSDRP